MATSPSTMRSHATQVIMMLPLIISFRALCDKKQRKTPGKKTRTLIA
jgi:hypothetical protein